MGMGRSLWKQQSALRDPSPNQRRHELDFHFSCGEPGARTKQKTYEETLDEIYRKYTDTVRDFRAGKVSAGNLKDQYLGYKVLKGKLS